VLLGYLLPDNSITNNCVAVGTWFGGPSNEFMSEEALASSLPRSSFYCWVCLHSTVSQMCDLAGYPPYFRQKVPGAFVLVFSLATFAVPNFVYSNYYFS